MSYFRIWTQEEIFGFCVLLEKILLFIKEPLEYNLKSRIFKICAIEMVQLAFELVILWSNECFIS